MKRDKILLSLRYANPTASQNFAHTGFCLALSYHRFELFCQTVWNRVMGVPRGEKVL